MTELLQTPETLELIVAGRVTANIADAGNSYKDKIIVAAKHGYALVHRHTGEFSYIHEVWGDQEGLEKAERYVSPGRRQPCLESQLIRWQDAFQRRGCG